MAEATTLWWLEDVDSNDNIYILSTDCGFDCLELNWSGFFVAKIGDGTNDTTINVKFYE